MRFEPGAFSFEKVFFSWLYNIITKKQNQIFTKPPTLYFVARGLYKINITWNNNNNKKKGHHQFIALRGLTLEMRSADMLLETESRNCEMAHVVRTVSEHQDEQRIERYDPKDVFEKNKRTVQSEKAFPS